MWNLLQNAYYFLWWNPLTKVGRTGKPQHTHRPHPPQTKQTKSHMGRKKETIWEELEFSVMECEETPPDKKNFSSFFFSFFFSLFFFLLLLLWLWCWLLWNQPRTKPQVSVHHHQLTFARMAGQHSQDYCLTFSTQENWKQPNKTNKIFSFFLVQKLPCEIWNMRSEKLFETWDLRSLIRFGF